MKVAALLSLVVFTSQVALADCDFARDIKAQPDGTYVYTKECHVKVGQTVADLKERTEQVEKLNKTIELKDLALKIADDRAMNLRDANFKMEDRINAAEKMTDVQKWVYFGLGVALTGLAVVGAGQLHK